MQVLFNLWRRVLLSPILYYDINVKFDDITLLVFQALHLV